MDFGQPAPHMSMDGADGHRPIAIQQSQRGGQGYANGFAAARSPPKAKNTSHVPCKFFPQGTCQAGAACQFSHDLDPTTQNAPCKYFARGSCKFGQSCALMHVLPDGRVINRASRGPQGSRRGMYQSGAPSRLSVNTHDPSYPMPAPMAFPEHDMNAAYIHQPSSPMFRSEIHVSGVSSPYGSPPGDLQISARSPPRSGLTARDAVLPNSFDSQGISLAARHGPFAASVPGRFGFESPSASVSKGQMGSAYRDLRGAAYGDTANLDGVLQGLGSSPHDSEPLSFHKRPLHSELHSERFSRLRQPMSSSLDVRASNMFIAEANLSEDEEDSDGGGEDLIPDSLHAVLQTEKTRRHSRSSNGMPSGMDGDDRSPWNKRGVSNGNGGSRVGSLSPQSASPSRYSAFFGARQSGTSLVATRPDDVGSPLRPSNLRTSSNAEGEILAASNGHSTQSGMSMLTSQLQRAKLGDTASSSLPKTTLTSASRFAGRPNITGHASPISTPSHSTNNLPGLSKNEDDTMFTFDDGEDEVVDGGSMGNSQIMGASQRLDGSVAEPPANQDAFAAPKTNGSSLGLRPVGAIGSGRGKS